MKLANWVDIIAIIEYHYSFCIKYPDVDFYKKYGGMIMVVKLYPSSGCTHLFHTRVWNRWAH